MPDRRQGNSSSTHGRSTGVRRNLFHQHLSRRPTTSSTSTSAETLRLDTEHESETSDIVIRDKNGDFEVVDPPIQPSDDQDEGGHADAREDESRIKDHLRNAELIDLEERQRLAEAVKHHQRDRNRAPSEPAELLEAVRTSLRAKVAALSEDNWMYEREEEPIAR